jgi:hypothetical protein
MVPVRYRYRDVLTTEMSTKVTLAINLSHDNEVPKTPNKMIKFCLTYHKYSSASRCLVDCLKCSGKYPAEYDCCWIIVWTDDDSTPPLPKRNSMDIH